MKYAAIAIAIVALFSTTASGQSTGLAVRGISPQYVYGMSPAASYPQVIMQPQTILQPQTVLVPRTVMVPQAIIVPTVVVRGQWVPRRVGLFGWQTQWQFLPNR